MPTPKSKHRQCSAEKQNAVETHFWSPRNAHHNQQLLSLSQARTLHQTNHKAKFDTPAYAKIHSN